MWQPNRAQWWIIWTVALVAILAWPPDAGRSLGMKAVNRAVDPAGALPDLPPPLPMSLGDNGDAVAAHDALETAYYQTRDRSRLMRWRMDLKAVGDPLDRSTMRQLVIGMVVLSALGVWRLKR
jgi:hypothetical protein